MGKVGNGRRRVFLAGDHLLSVNLTWADNLGTSSRKFDMADNLGTS
jgi:hypothetical protein